jgi:hypothetical protein
MSESRWPYFNAIGVTNALVKALEENVREQYKGKIEFNTDGVVEEITLFLTRIELQILGQRIDTISKSGLPH